MIDASETPVPDSAFVTGGSGFIGGRLVRRLAGGGTRVRALARSDRSAAAVESLGAEAVRGDLDDPASMVAGAEGCAITFHLAAHLGQWGTRAEFVRGNVTGTENALEASRRAGVGRFVHCGTEAALLAGEPLVEVDESAPLRPDSRALYSSTKAQAERLVRSANGSGFETVMLRPRLVWGVGDTTLLHEFVAAAQSGKLAWIGGGGHLTATTHVDNVVEGLLLAAAKGGAGEAYFVTDGEPVVFREFVSALLETQGVEPPTRSIPSWVGAGAAAACEAAWRLLPLGGEPPLTRLAYWLSAQECTIDISKARTELGYEPVIGREAGLAELRGA
ncbi:MAG: NAD-dependent epimerase/dehydratase family protein [Solirubrobacterales bacterium]